MYDSPATLGRDLAQFARAILLCRGKLVDAEFLAEPFASPRVRAILRAVPGTANPASPGWGAELTDWQTTLDSYFASLRFSGAFDAMLPAMRRLPMRARLIASTTAVGSAPGEGQSKAVSSLSLNGGQLMELKAQTTVVVSEEIARLGGQLATDFLLGELQGGTASATDLEFLAAITAGAPANPASGTDAESFRQDLQVALGLLGLGATSKPYILLAPATALALSLMMAPGGGAEFPDLGPMGGTIANLPALVSDGLAGDSSDTVAVVDATGIAADPGELLIQAAEHATVDLGDGAVSLWQLNLLALRVERLFGASLARADAVATITGAAYGPSETSP